MEPEKERKKKISRQDVEQFAGKLQEWAKGLSPEEAALLKEVLANTRFEPGTTQSAEVTLADPGFRTHVTAALQPLASGELELMRKPPDVDFWVKWMARTS